MKHSLVLRATSPFDYLDDEPAHALIPGTTSTIKHLQESFNQAEAISIPHLSHISIHDHTPQLLNHKLDVEELEALNILPAELTHNGEFLLIPTPTEEKLQEYGMRVELTMLEVYAHGNCNYTGLVKHTDIPWSTSSFFRANLPALHEFLATLELQPA